MVSILGALWLILSSPGAACSDAPVLPSGFHARPSYRPNDPDRRTICLIHGINSTSHSFVNLVGPLEDAGFGVVFYTYPFDRDLDASTVEFARDWKAFRRDQGEKQPWTILSHSMGGLLARSYVEGDDFGGDVGDLLLIGPTNHGSAAAKGQPLLQLVRQRQALKDREAGAFDHLNDRLGASAQDLLPGSSFLKKLNARPRRRGVRYHILAGSGGFISKAARKQIDAQIQAGRGVVAIMPKKAKDGLFAALDEMTEGLGDGCVSIASTRLEGVDDHEIIRANHVELIRGPLLFPDPGPVACMPFVLKRLSR